MDVVRQVSHDDLVTQFQDSRDFQYIEWALKHHSYFYIVALYSDDIGNLILNSSPQNSSPGLGVRHPNIEEVLKEIKADPDFLKLTKAEDFRGLNGKRVREKVQDFELGKTLGDCFIMDTWHEEMLREEPYYVIDGMHSLVAYALWSGLDSRKFPIRVFLCTNSIHQIPTNEP